MHMLTRRTQILLDEDRHRRLERAAEASGRSIAAIIREAIDEKLGIAEDIASKRAAGEAMLSEPTPTDDREPDWHDVKLDFLDTLYRSSA